MSENQYDAQSIVVLKGLEAVKKRPGMYIGDTEDGSGLHHMIYEVVDNAVDEALAGHCDTVRVELHSDGSVSVSDNGRGIPVDMHEEGVSAAEVIMTQLHAGGKFDKNSYKVSGGLHGVGVSVVNALSEWLEVNIFKNGKEYSLRFENGYTVKSLQELGETQKSGTSVRFKASIETFKNIEFSFTTIETKMRELAFLNSGVRFYLLDSRKEEKTEREFFFEGGLIEYVKYLNKSKNGLHDVLYFQDEKNDISVEIAMQWTDAYHENEVCFTNNIRQRDGGTHLTGFKSGITRCISNYFEQFVNPNNKKKMPDVVGEDIREGLTFVISAKVPDPKFSSQTKDKLVSSEVRPVVENVIFERFFAWLEKNPNEAKVIIQKIQQSSLAREAAKKAREMTRKTESSFSSSLPSKLSDCQSNNPAEKELFIVEGESAGGTAKQGRDRKYQAVLALRGKIMNVEKMRFDKVLDVDSIASIIGSVGTGIGKDEFDIEKARYHKIIIMTDADIDGSHIRSLLLTFFFRYMPKIIESGYLYVSQPPLYRIKQGQKVRYVKNDEQMNEFLFSVIESEAKVIGYNGSIRDFILDVYKMIRIFSKEKRADISMIEALVASNLSSHDLHNTSKIEDLITFLNTYHDAKNKSFAFEEKTEENFIISKINRGIKEYYNIPLASFEIVDTLLKYGNLELLHNIITQKIEVFFKDNKLMFNGMKELFDKLLQHAKSNLSIQRFKGLGEMNMDQLWDTTLNPETRTLLQVKIEDLVETDRVFSMLMGDDVSIRRDFIVENSQNIVDIDI